MSFLNYGIVSETRVYAVLKVFTGVEKTGNASKKPEESDVYKPKPYEQMTYPGERVQVDVKVVPRKCIAGPEMKLYSIHTAIDEYTRIRFLYGYEEQSTYSSADFVNRLVKWYKRRGITVKCISDRQWI